MTGHPLVDTGSSVTLARAAAAHGMGIPGRAIRDRPRDRPASQSANATAAHGRFVTAPGGVPVLDRR